MALTKVSFSMITGAPANVVDFGADSTGVADSRQAILDAMTASNVVYFPPGTYRSSATIEHLDKNFEFQGNGATLTFDAGYLSVGGSIGSAYTLSANVDFGANVFTVSGGSFTAGSIMMLVDTTAYSFSLHNSLYHKGQLFSVVDESSNVITTAENALASWTTGGAIQVKKISPVQITIRDLTVLAPNDTVSEFACSVEYAQNVYIENCKFKGGDVTALQISNSKGAEIRASDCVCEAPITTGLQYGVSISDSENVLIDSCYLYGTRHATGLGGAGNSGTKFVTVQNSILTGDLLQLSYKADIHGNCAYITYQNNTIYGGANIGGEYASYLNNVIFANNNGTGTGFDPAIDYTEIVGGNFIVDGNQIYMPEANNYTIIIGTTSSAFLGKINYSYNFQITNNEFVVQDTQTTVVSLGTHYSAPTVQPSLTWENNKFRNDCAGLERVVELASIPNPATSAYVDATGPFLINDFTLQDTMSSAIKIFEATQGTLATGAEFYLPERTFRVTSTIDSGYSTITKNVTYPFDYGDYVPPTQATIENTAVQNGLYTYSGIASSLSTGCTVVLTTGKTTDTLSAGTAYTANVRVGGPLTLP